MLFVFHVLAAREALKLVVVKVRLLCKRTGSLSGLALAGVKGCLGTLGRGYGSKMVISPALGRGEICELDNGFLVY